MGRLSPERIEALLEVARSVRVLVIGDLMLDRYVVGSVERTSPEAPVPVVLVEDEYTAMGGAANVAANVTALGAVCDVVGLVGDDQEGVELRSALEQAGVGTEGLVTAEDRPTTVKTRVVARHQQVVRFDREVEADAGREAMAAMLRAVERLAPIAHAVVTQDYDKGVLVAKVIRTALEHARAAGVPVVCDPKSRSFFEYRGATVFKPNARELAQAFAGRACPDDESWMESARQRLECDSLLVTLGEAGLALKERDEPLVRVPTVARDVYDVSGAGDTVAAGVALGLAAGGTVAEAALLGNQAAAIEVGKAGVATVSPRELIDNARILEEEHAP